MNETIESLETLRLKLQGSFLLFTQTFFPLVTGREFTLSNPLGQESHFITVSRALTSVARLQVPNYGVNMPPGYGKSAMCCFWVAWCLALYPDCQFLYITYGKSLAIKHTEFIRRIIMNPMYKAIFGVSIKDDSRAKEAFQTVQGGSVKAFGSSGPITGQDAGLPHLNRFSGAVIIDDAHKPDEVHSDSVREGVIQNYKETILQRPRGPNVPILFIGQCLHEADLAMYLRSGEDIRKWDFTVLKALNVHNNPLYPEVHTREFLLEMQAKNEYVFSSQYQQEPVPAGGALYKEKDFVLLGEEPKILLTFITADTAETSDTYNDATVFSFWGLYKIEYEGQETGQFGLHWIDCHETRIEPKDLKNEFLGFYGECMMHKVKPLLACIEKKSTGVTLLSALQDIRGLQIRDIPRTVASKSKNQRFVDLQHTIASKSVSFTFGAKHTDMCIRHMVKITANGTHRHDDIADTCYDACKIALIDRSLTVEVNQESNKIVKGLADSLNHRIRAQQKGYGYGNFRI